MESRFSDVMYFSHVALCDFFFNPWMLLYYEFCPETPQHRFAVLADVSRVCNVVYERSWPWRLNQTVLKMYGSEPYQFKWTYPPEEEPVLHVCTWRRRRRRRKKRFTRTWITFQVPKSNLDLLWNLLMSVCCSFSNIFYNKKPLTSFLIGTWPLSIRVQTQIAGVSCHTTPVRSLANLVLL